MSVPFQVRLTANDIQQTATTAAMAAVTAAPSAAVTALPPRTA